jgi:HAE1 family hydrophobic/amphiphilic exporter-1
LQWTLRHQRAVLIAFLAYAVLTGVLFYRAPKGFLPSEDSGQLFCFVEGPQDISFEAMADLQRRVAEIIGQDPNVEAAMSFVGATGFSPSLNVGRITVTLKPFKESQACRRRWCAVCGRSSPTCSASRPSSRTCPRSASAAS